LIPGTNDYAPGDLRISFLVVDNRGRLVAPPRARFWIARSLAAKPFQRTVARLEPVGVAGVSQVEDVPSGPARRVLYRWASFEHLRALSAKGPIAAFAPGLSLSSRSCCAGSRRKGPNAIARSNGPSG
jgi:hypothetical protein